ncbi:MAG: STAS domain-containing protein [Cellulomonadaceae bacterium]
MHGTTAAGGIQFDVLDGRGRVTMWGEIDVDLRNQASVALASSLESNLPVVIDASQVTFIDSTGIAFLLQFHTIGRQEGIEVRLVQPPAVVADVLEMLGLDQELTITESAEDTGSGRPAPTAEIPAVSVA